MSESIGANIEKVKKYRAEKRSLIDSLKDMNERLRILDAQKQNLVKNLPANCRNEKDLKKEIKEKRRKYEHSSLSSVEEKKILREIDLLK